MGEGGDGNGDVGDGRLLSGDFRLSLPATTLLLVSLLPPPSSLHPPFTPFPTASCRVACRWLCANFVRCRRHGVLFNVMLANLNSAQLSSLWFALFWIQRPSRRQRRRRSVSWTWAHWQILNETRTRRYPRTQGRLRRRRCGSRRSLSAAFVGSLSFSRSCVLGPCCAKTW